MYDAWNRLVELTNGNAVVSVYAYDGASRRTTKTVGNTTRHYYYDEQWRVAEERLDTTTTADRRFVWGIRRLDDLILRDRASAIRLYALDDKINVTAVVDVTGTVQERYGYNGFGTPRYMNASFSTRTTPLYDWETLFDSYRYDTESGLYQVRYRYLHPLLGRWITRDPLGELGFEAVRTQSTLLFSNRTSPDWINRCPIGKKCVNQLSDKKAKLLLGRINLYEFVKNSPVGQIDVHGLINSHFPQYGNYCGAGWCGGEVVKPGKKCNYSVASTSEMDTCCQAHDKCYDNACKGKVDQSKVRDCDKTLCQCMKDVDKSNFTSEDDEIHYGELVTWACGIRGGGPIG
jgi:RHS repeat-associated protein